MNIYLRERKTLFRKTPHNPIGKGKAGWKAGKGYWGTHIVVDSARFKVF